MSAAAGPGPAPDRCGDRRGSGHAVEYICGEYPNHPRGGHICWCGCDVQWRVRKPVGAS